MILGNGKTRVADALGRALADAKVTFACLLPEPSADLKQPPLIRRRVVTLSINPTAINIGPSTKCHDIYSLGQAMSTLESCDESESIRVLLKQMI